MDSSDDEFNFDGYGDDFEVGPVAQRALAQFSDSEGEDDRPAPAPVVPMQRRQRRKSDENYYGEFDNDGYRIPRREMVGGTLNNVNRPQNQRSYSPTRKPTEANVNEYVKKHTNSTIEAVDSSLNESTAFYKTQLSFHLSNDLGIDDVPDMINEYNVELNYDILNNFEDDLYNDENGLKAALAEMNSYDSENGIIDEFPSSKTEKFRKLKKGSTEKVLKELKETRWQLSHGEIKEYVDSAKLISDELLRADHIANIYARSANREPWASIDEELERRDDIFNAEMDSSGTEVMLKFTEKMKRHRHTFKKFLDGVEEDVIMEDEDLVSKCPISKKSIRQAARTTCRHIFDYDSLIQHYEHRHGKKQDKKLESCPQPGCLSTFKKADIKKDAVYQQKLDLARQEGDISDCD